MANFLSDYLLYNSGNECPHNYHIWSALAVVASTVGPKVHFDYQYIKIFLNPYIILVGEQGNDSSWPSSCGEGGRRAVAQISLLVEQAQLVNIPCFFTLFEIDPNGSDMGVYRRKRDLLNSERWCLAGSEGAQMVSALSPSKNDIVFTKKKPSGFHGTPLLGYLVDRCIDTVIIVGGATSNCIRATVFDSSSYNFRTIVPQEAVFDRIPISHAISLFDMDRQFADVMPMAEVIE